MEIRINHQPLNDLSLHHETPMKSNNRLTLIEAIEDGDILTIQERLAREPLLVNDTGQSGGITPLMYAVSSRRRTPLLIKTLLDVGADVNFQSEEGCTALHMLIDADGPTAASDTPAQIAQLLVDAGADLEARQQWGWTPLMKAAIEGLPNELQAMVDVGGNLDQVFPSHTLPTFLPGRTTLMATIGEPEHTRILIDAGANLRALDAHGQTVLSYARQCLAEAMENNTGAYESDRDAQESEYVLDLRQSLQLVERAFENTP